MAGGTFGSGTVTFNLSPDGGVTLYPLIPLNGTAGTLTAIGAIPFVVGNGGKNSDAPEIEPEHHRYSV